MSEYTAEQVERAAQDWETFGATDAPAMLRAYAATLRQQQEYPECSGNPASCPEKRGLRMLCETRWTDQHAPANY